VNFDEAYGAIASKIKTLKGSEIAALSGSLSSAEEIFALKNLMEKIGSDNIDCRLNGEKIDSSDRASYLCNTTIAGIEEADACLLIGVNPRKDAPLLNARIRKRFLSKKLKIAAIGCDADLTYAYENLGDASIALENVFNCESKFSAVLKNAQKPMLILGTDLLTRKDGAAILEYAKKIAENNGLIKEDWNGFNLLTKSTGLVNGLELGFTPKKSETDVNSILENCQKGEIKAVFLHGVDDEIDFSKLENSFVIYIGSHGDEGAKNADVILPASAYSEKESIYVNLEGRPQISAKAVSAPGEAKEDCQIILELAHKLNFDLGYKNLAELRNSLASSHPIFASLDQVTKAVWNISKKAIGEFEAEKFSIKNYNFYLTNPIARASRTLNKCGN